MTHRRLIILGALALAFAAWGYGIDRGIVEDGTDANTAEDATDGGVALVKRNGTTRLRPATCAASSCTRVVPDAGAEGLHLEDVASWVVAVTAPGDQTLTGTGKLEAYRYDPVTRVWGHMKSKDLDVTDTGRSQFFPVELNGMMAAGARFLYRPNGVGVSGNDGGSLTTSLQACKRGPEGGLTLAPGCGP